MGFWERVCACSTALWGAKWRILVHDWNTVGHFKVKMCFSPSEPGITWHGTKLLSAPNCKLERRCLYWLFKQLWHDENLILKNLSCILRALNGRAHAQHSKVIIHQYESYHPASTESFFRFQSVLWCTLLELNLNFLWKWHVSVRGLSGHSTH